MRLSLRHTLPGLTAALLLLKGVPCATAQTAAAAAPTTSWDRLRAVPDVDTAEVRWLQDNLAPAEASQLFALLDGLSRPEAVQLLPSFAYLEGTTGPASIRAFIDSLGKRPPAGEAGRVRAAYLLARSRQSILYYRRSTYQPKFDNRALTVPATPAAPAQPGAAVRLSLDFAPAETLLAIVTTPDIRYDEALKRISTPAFDALIRHHSQNFYPVPLSREQLALNLTHAASTQPLDRLYRYARPNGFYHFADVHDNAAQYRHIVDELGRHEKDIAAYLNAVLAPYIPAGTKVDRRVSFYFDDMSDGWGVGPIAAVPLEYYKDDYARMLNTMVHETFHAAQNAVSTASPPPARLLANGADSAFMQAMNYLLAEGTANFIAPSVVRSPQSADSMSRAAGPLLIELAAMRHGGWDASRAQELLNKGVSGGGPFYWLGAAMSRALIERDGPRAIGRALQSDGLAFARQYLTATSSGPESLLPPAVAEAVTALTTAH